MLPGSDADLLLVRPLGGADDEVTGICRSLEPVQPASFPLPDPASTGDYRSCRLLRDVLRLGFRSSTGPFRCSSRIAVEPRPYQLVPLLMALKLDPMRLLIADEPGGGRARRGSQRRRRRKRRAPLRPRAFEGDPAAPSWLPDDHTDRLLGATPAANVTPEQARHFLGQVVAAHSAWAPHIDSVAYDRADAALAAHRRVRTAGGQRGISQRIEPHLPPDVLGVYVLLPVVE